MNRYLSKESIMLSSSLAQARVLFAIIAAAIIVSACGGGGGGSGATSTAGVGSGGTGSGVITGFASIIMDGMDKDDTGATYTSEADQGSPVTVPITGAMLGQNAEFAYNASGAMTSVMLSPQFVGTVSSVAANSFTVLGTTITVNSDPTLGPVTSFVGYASMAGMRAGDTVEADGLLKTDAQGKPYLQATLIVGKPSTAGVRLTGYVSQYNASAGTFVLGSNTITVGAATITPAGSTLANGELVTVWSNAGPVGNTITATTIRVKNMANGNVVMSGSISNFVSNASFQIGNVTVNASAATIAPSGATLGNNNYVLVTGTFDATANKLTATSVTVFTASAPTTVELHGMVANFVSSSSFTIRGVTVDASAATFSGGTASQLANGGFVIVHGNVANNVVHATTVGIQATLPMMAPNGSTIEISGAIASYNAGTGAFTMTLASGATMNGTVGPASSIVTGRKQISSWDSTSTSPACLATTCFPVRWWISRRVLHPTREA
jgi:Domain of unknown function (DUF5666)